MWVEFGGFDVGIRTAGRPPLFLVEGSGALSMVVVVAEELILAD